MRKFFGPAILLGLLAAVVCATPQTIANSANVDFFYPQMAPYRLQGGPATAFPDFSLFRLAYPDGHHDLQVDSSGAAPIKGYLQLIDRTTYHFKSAKLIPEVEGFMKLKFKTQRIRGVHYVFEGRFLKRAKPTSDGGFTSLMGTLTKFLGKKRVATAELGFFEWTYE